MDVFVGGGAISAVLAPHFEIAIANDMHPDLIAMYHALKEGWVPPNDVSEQEYATLKSSTTSALRGFVGFGCSFSGKWFSGYARRLTAIENFALEAKRAVLRDIEKMRNVIFVQGSYTQLHPPHGSVVYCDPPYSSTTGYSVGDFDSAQFWDVCRKWRASGVHVYVSEYSAPKDWEPIWTKVRRQGLRSANRIDGLKLETLYV